MGERTDEREEEPRGEGSPGTVDGSSGHGSSTGAAPEADPAREAEADAGDESADGTGSPASSGPDAPGSPRSPRATAPPGGFSPKTLELLAERGIEVRVHELGGRGARLFAWFLDSLITNLATLLVLLSLRPEMFEPAAGQELLEFGVPDLVGFTGTLFLVYMLLHGPFLARTGQTIGKRALRLRIADSRDGSVPDLMRLLLRRTLPFLALQAVPSLGPGVLLGDSIGIFRGDRRCLHDLVAGTVVLRA